MVGRVIGTVIAMVFVVFLVVQAAPLVLGMYIYGVVSQTPQGREALAMAHEASPAVQAQRMREAIDRIPESASSTSGSVVQTDYSRSASHASYRPGAPMLDPKPAITPGKPMVDPNPDHHRN
jgi:hypothetical protein